MVATIVETRDRILADETLRAELDLCDRWGIPHSHFLGAVLFWSEYDRVKALAFRELARETCQGCGTRLAEWDPDRGGDRNARVADTLHCEGCDRIESLLKQVPSEQVGVKVYLRPRTADEQ